MPNFSSAQLEKVCTEFGWGFKRQKGSHRILHKESVPRPIVIPKCRNLSYRVLSNTARDLGITLQELKERMRS